VAILRDASLRDAPQDEACEDQLYPPDRNYFHGIDTLETRRPAEQNKEEACSNGPRAIGSRIVDVTDPRGLQGLSGRERGSRSANMARAFWCAAAASEQTRGQGGDPVTWCSSSTDYAHRAPPAIAHPNMRPLGRSGGGKGEIDLVIVEGLRRRAPALRLPARHLDSGWQSRLSKRHFRH